MAAAMLLAMMCGVLGGVFGVVLRAAGLGGSVRAAGVVGGVIAGVLLGPLVLGNVAPEMYGALVTGGVEERAALVEAERAHARDVRAAVELGAGAEAVGEMEGAWAERRTALEDALVAALEARAVDVRLVVGVLAGLLLGPMVASALVRLSGRRRGMSGVVAVSGGLGVVLLASLLPMAVATVGLGEGVVRAGAFALVMGTLGCWWSAPRRVGAIGAAGLAVGTGAMCALVWSESGGVVLVAALCGAVVSGVVGWWMCVGLRERWGRRAWEWIPGVLVVPMLVGVVMSGIDPAAVGLDVRFVTATVLMILFASDGRWMSAALVWRMLAGRGMQAWMQSARLVNAGSGMAQLAMLGLAVGGGLIDAALSASAVVGALAIEVMAGLRVRMARRVMVEMAPGE